MNSALFRLVEVTVVVDRWPAYHVQNCHGAGYGTGSGSGFSIRPGGGFGYADGNGIGRPGP